LQHALGQMLLMLSREAMMTSSLFQTIHDTDITMLTSCAGTCDSGELPLKPREIKVAARGPFSDSFYALSVNCTYIPSL